MSLKNGTLLTIFALSSSVTFAGTMGPICNQKVTLPCPRNAFSLGAQALYLKPSYAGDSFQSLASTSSNLVNLTNNYNSLNPWQWGFEIDAAYRFSTGNDIAITWYHWNDSITTAYTDTNLTSPIKVYYSVLTGNFLYNPTFKFQPMLDTVNLEFAQMADFGPNWSARFHGGASFAKIIMNHSEISETPPASTSEQFFVLNAFINRSFVGGGPRVGADFSFQKINNFTIYSKTAGGLLVGTSKFNASTIAQVDILTHQNHTNYGSTTIISPEIDEKLGAQYTFTIPQGFVTADLGWIWMNYFSPMERPVNTSNNQSTTFNTKSTNFGLQGVYFGVSVLGNSFM